uniref:Glucagon / GIP / secretin / VIP family domain-containing protein n=1 Tax=Oreochromis niloticus TaxID=8128 RepID=A0A669E5B9_ORENI
AQLFTGEGHHMVRNLKRHSDGTFTSDFTHYLDKIKKSLFLNLNLFYLFMYLFPIRKWGEKDAFVVCFVLLS